MKLLLLLAVFLLANLTISGLFFETWTVGKIPCKFNSLMNLLWSDAEPPMRM